MTDIAEFLTARIAEDEAEARRALAADDGSGLWVVTGMDNAVGVDYDPARVLAECAAKRRVVQRYTVAATRLERQQGDRAIEGIRANESYAVLKLLALPYADHPDYDPSWRP